MDRYCKYGRDAATIRREGAGRAHERPATQVRISDAPETRDKGK